MTVIGRVGGAALAIDGELEIPVAVLRDARDSGRRTDLHDLEAAITAIGV